MNSDSTGGGNVLFSQGSSSRRQGSEPLPLHRQSNAVLSEILGAKANATPAELARAYKKMALKWHPDKCNKKGPASEVKRRVSLHTEKFQKINEAYDVLRARSIKV